MELTCVQPGYLFEHRRALETIPLPTGDGKLLFLGIPGKIHNVDGSYVLRYKQDAERSKGIVLYLSGAKFQVDLAKDLPNEIKFFIDGVEMMLKRNVIVVGCKGRYILNEDRWPAKAEPPDQSILTNEQAKESEDI